MRKLIILSFLLSAISSQAQQQIKKVLFLGNSYTYANNLPLMLAKMAQSSGDSLIYDQNTPGGYQLWQHDQNATSTSKINSKAWDHVVLQEQSYVGTVPWARDNFSYPAIINLNKKVEKNNPCSKTLLYMTWGRKNAFTGFVTDGNNVKHYTPSFANYAHMQDSLKTFYMNIANKENLEVSPVGMVWKKVVTNHPGYELYTSDGSHPNVSGTYVAACSFYASIFHKSPNSTTFLPNGVDAAMAQFIKNYTDTVVLQNLNTWNIDTTSTLADFSTDTTGLQVTFTNKSKKATSFSWDFGDGNTSTQKDPIHTYSKDSTYTVILTAMSQCDTSKFTLKVTVKSPSGGTSVQEWSKRDFISIYPTPANNILNVVNAQLNTTYSIFDINGKEVMNGKILSVNQKLNIQHLTGGVYFIQMKSKRNVYQHLKFIKNE